MIPWNNLILILILIILPAYQLASFRITTMPITASHSFGRNSQFSLFSKRKTELLIEKHAAERNRTMIARSKRPLARSRAARCKPCVCCSGKKYDDCCRLLHYNLIPYENATPEQIYRARFSGVDLGVANFTLKCVHPAHEVTISHHLLSISPYLFDSPPSTSFGSTHSYLGIPKSFR
jgi:hypothetical protein